MKKYIKEATSGSENMRRRKKNNVWLSYHVELELATNNIQINFQAHTKSPQAPVITENFFKFKNHLTTAIRKFGNFYPIKQPILLRTIPISQIVLPQQNFV